MTPESAQIPVGMMPLHVDVQIIQDDQVTAASIVTPQGVPTVVGSSKKHPKDEFNSFVGQAMALARLFRALADGYEEAASKVMEAPTDGLARLNKAVSDFLNGHGVPASELG